MSKLKVHGHQSGPWAFVLGLLPALTGGSVGERAMLLLILSVMGRNKPWLQTEPFMRGLTLPLILRLRSPLGAESLPRHLMSVHREESWWLEVRVLGGKCPG